MNFRDHFSLISRDLTANFHDFSWRSRQTRQAVKTALACVTSILIVFFLDLKEAYWAAITTVVMMQPNVAASLRKGWMRAGGACCGCFLAVIITGIFLQQHVPFTIFFFFLAALGLYLGTTVPSGYFWSYFILNAVLISMVAMTEPDITLYITVHRGAVITIGVLVSLMVNVVFFPDYASETVEEEFDRFCMELFKWIREIIYQYLNGDYRPERVEDKYLQLVKGEKKITVLLRDAAMEMKVLRGELGILDLLFERLCRRAEDFHGFYQGLLQEKPDHAYQENHRTALEGLLEKMDNLSEPDGWQGAGRMAAAKAMTCELATMESVYQETLECRHDEKYGVFDFLIFLELIYLLRRVVNDLSMEKREEFISDVALETDSNNIEMENTDLFRFKLFHRTRAIHIPSLKYAVKGALGIVSVFWFWFWAEIPGNALNMSVAVITVLQQDLMFTYHKGLLRFLGCLAGALTGYAFLGLQVESTFYLCASTFMVIFFFAYIWGGRPGAAYLGCQAAICYLVATIHDLHAVTSLAPPTERLVGIFLGVLFTWVINLLLWREDLLERFRGSLRFAEKKIAGIGEEMAAKFQGSRRSKPVGLDVAALQATLQQLFKQVELSADEAIPVRSWLAQLRYFAEESAGMEAANPETSALLKELNPDFIPRLVETVFLVSLAQSEKDYHFLFLQLEEREREFNQMIVDLRKGVILSKPMMFKQRFAHTLIICRRIIYRLHSLADSGRRFSVKMRQ